MSRIAVAFDKAKKEKRAAFIPFVMAGDPTPEASAKILDMLPEAGADIVELGIPFSDPMADGPVIQAAGRRALKAGTTLKKVLELAKHFRAKHANTPLVLMGYINPLFIYGYEAFARDAATAGIDGIIIVDLPPEEASEIEPYLSRNNIALVRLIAPTSVPGRLPLLTKGAQGYLYYVSITGITGATAAKPTDIKEQVATIRAATNLPICVGFGIKTAADVKSFAPHTDGVVVGSALVKKVEETKADAKKIGAFVKELVDGCRL